MIKKKVLHRQISILSLIIVLTGFAACATISTFDQYAYTQTTSLKVDALNVMSLGTDSFMTHRTEVKALQTNLQKAYEYEKNRPLNQVTLQLWDKLLNPDGHLLGGFLKRWETKGALTDAFVEQTKKQTAEAFDVIASLESGKLKSKEIKK